MPNFKSAALAASLFAFGCGNELLIQQSGPVSTFDSERAADPALAAEAALRLNPEHDVHFLSAEAEFGVPAALLKGLSFSLTRYDMVMPEVEFESDSEEAEPATGFGMMALPAEGLEAAAARAKVTVEQAKSDRLANVRVAAAALSALADELALERSTLSSWAPALARYAGITDAAGRTAFVEGEVLETIRLGVGLEAPPLADDALGEQLGTLRQGLDAAPDFKRGKWYPSNHYTSRSGHTAKMVVIHTCEIPYATCRDYLRSNTRSVSSHYVVGATEVAQLVRESNRAHHIGAYYACSNNGGTSCNLNGVQSNYFTIGIEHGGYASQTTFPPAQLENSAKLLCNISKDHGIPRDRFHVVGHGKLQPYNRTDPGPNWPWAKYIQMANKYCEPPDSPDEPDEPGTPAQPTQIVIDTNNDRNDTNRGYIKVSSHWVGKSDSSQMWGTGYYVATTKAISDGAEFWFHLGKDQTRQIDARWVAGANRSDAASFVAFNAEGAKVGSHVVNQKTNGAKWVDVGTYKFTKGWNVVVLSRWAAEGSVVVADAIAVR